MMMIHQQDLFIKLDMVLNQNENGLIKNKDRR